MTDDEKELAARYVEIDDVDQETAEANIRRAFARRSPEHKAKVEARMRQDLAMEERQLRAENRAHALRTIHGDGKAVYYAACACKWHGLRGADPELALREYDAHPCSISFRDDSVVDRELKLDADGRLVRRPASQLALNTVLPDGTIINGLDGHRPDEVGVGAGAKPTTADEDQAKRFALLELK